ncbi:MAG TPA: serine/threonine-protein kinase [Solirubrobacteraceae bacterium]|nr:serine/threonine-protein kinase [Solirubrobacteraceae bacterium]
MESPDTLVEGALEGRTLEPNGPRILPGRGPVAGAVLLGRYRLRERLGAGGFGEVWRAHDELLHRDVAVKRIHLGAGGDRIDGERAEREALASARLAHPAIVALYEACAREDAFYLISELIEGETLARLIAEDALADDEILEIGLALSMALVHAHSRGVIHRDIKPHNVLVPREPQDAAGAAKLTDFGGASLTGEDALTRTGDVLGTLAYMAPEQSDGAEVGAEADLYSLALVLYEALSGSNPIRGATPAATARRIGRPIESLARSRGDLPRVLTRAIDRALAPAPRERGSIEELSDGLAQAPHGRRARTALPRARPAATAAARAPIPARVRGSSEVGAPAGVPQPAPAPPSPATAEHRIAQRAPGQRLAQGLPRTLWLACALGAIVWQVWAGRPGVGLLATAALAPLLALPPRSGPGWLVAALAPALGTLGLAGAFPAIAGQARRWRARAMLGALGFWWLTLAEPLLSQRLWLGVRAGTPPRAVWEGSLSSAAVHVIAPLLTLTVLLGAALWAAAAVTLPWLVRGRSAPLDVVAATVWAVAVAAAVPVLIAAAGAHAPPASARGIALGAVLGGLLAVAARAVRGPVRPSGA